MKKIGKSIKINAILNSIKSILSIVFPLITFPYVTRILGVDNLGAVTYAQAIVSYFSLFAGLGISTYAVREGAKIRDDSAEFQLFCNEVFTINVISTLFAYILLIITVFSVESLSKYISLIILLSVSIFFVTIGVDWLNVIFEDYLYITIRGVVIQIIIIALTFIFVRSEHDYFIYALLTIVTQVIIGVSNYVYCKRYCKIRLTFHPKVKKHLKSILILFANNVAVTLYCNVDSIMIGWICSDFYVGLYSVSVKVYSMIRSLLASIFMVCIPRLSYYKGKNLVDEFNKLICNITEVLLIIIVPIIIGINLLSKEIILIISGSGYLGATPSLNILSLGLLFAILGGIITNCINIPNGKEKNNLYATLIAAMLNVLLNIFFISTWKQNGAAITTVMSELAVVIVCILLDKTIIRIFNYRNIIKYLFQSFIGCIGIFGAKYIISILFKNSILICLLTIIISVVFYICALLIFKNTYLLNIFDKVKKKYKRT